MDILATGFRDLINAKYDHLIGLQPHESIQWTEEFYMNIRPLNSIKVLKKT